MTLESHDLPYDPNAEPSQTEKIESLRKKLQTAVDQQNYDLVINISEKLQHEIRGSCYPPTVYTFNPVVWTCPVCKQLWECSGLYRAGMGCTGFTWRKAKCKR